MFGIRAFFKSFGKSQTAPDATAVTDLPKTNSAPKHGIDAVMEEFFNILQKQEYRKINPSDLAHAFIGTMVMAGQSDGMAANYMSFGKILDEKEENVSLVSLVSIGKRGDVESWYVVWAQSTMKDLREGTMALYPTFIPLKDFATCVGGKTFDEFFGSLDRKIVKSQYDDLTPSLQPA